MTNIIAQLLGHTYQIELITEDCSLRHISYYRGSAWAAAASATDFAKEKSTGEKRAWTVNDIKRV